MCMYKIFFNIKKNCSSCCLSFFPLLGQALPPPTPKSEKQQLWVLFINT